MRWISSGIIVWYLSILRDAQQVFQEYKHILYTLQGRQQGLCDIERLMRNGQ